MSSIQQSSYRFSRGAAEVKTQVRLGLVPPAPYIRHLAFGQLQRAAVREQPSLAVLAVVALVVKQLFPDFWLFHPP